MNRRTIFWIVAGVLLFHVGAFLLIGRMRALPRVHTSPSARAVPKPNFGYREEVFEDPRTGSKVTFREIQVSTQLADPKLLPPTPAPRATPAATPATTTP